MALASSAAMADVYPTPTVETLVGNSTITGSATDPTLTTNGNGEGFLDYGVTINLCSLCSITGTGVETLLSIPMLISYSLSANSGAGQGLAEIGIYDVTSTLGFEDQLNCSEDGGTCGTVSAVNKAFDYDYGFCDADSNCVSQMTAYVNIHTYASNGGYAQVDPTFSIDPTYLRNHPGTSLTVTNVPIPAVPEPATWAMMLVGVFGLGGALRARQRSLASA